jgi:transketolase
LILNETGDLLTVTTASFPRFARTLVQAMADLDGIAHMRTTRGAYPVLYDATATFTVGGSKVLRESGDDQLTLIGAGPTELVVAHLAVRELPGSGTSAELLG